MNIHDKTLSLIDVELIFLRELEYYSKNNDDLGIGLAKWALAVLRRLYPELETGK